MGDNDFLYKTSIWLPDNMFNDWSNRFKLDYPWKWIKSSILRTKAIFIGREFIIQIGMVALFMMLVWYWVVG